MPSSFVARFPRAALALALVALLHAAARAEESSFVRFARGRAPGSGALQTAYATYRSDRSGVEVTLYGVVHMADAAYYEQVQRNLDECDAVLYEGVKGAEGAEPTDDMRALSEIQHAMAELFDFRFQKDGIDYGRKNLVHADMTAEELLKKAGGDLRTLMPGAEMFQGKNVKGLLPLMKLAAQLGKQFLASDPRMRDELKMQLASQLGTADIGAAMGSEAYRLILIERNKVAFKVLEEQLAARKGGRVAVFYGAAHLPDLEERLAEIGFRRVEKRWETAWRIGAFEEGHEGDGRGEPEPRPEARPEREREPERAPAPAPARPRKVYY